MDEARTLQMPVMVSDKNRPFKGMVIANTSKWPILTDSVMIRCLFLPENTFMQRINDHIDWVLTDS